MGMDEQMIKQLPLVYVAGPITIPDPIWNTHNATRVAEELYATGLCVPCVSHFNIVWHLIYPHDNNHWYEYDMHILRRCNALFRIHGLSVGADAEEAQAREWGIPTFGNDTNLLNWCRRYQQSITGGLI